MIDLQSISSNLLLVGFVLISICCLYLLYSNFSKINTLNELKRNVEDLKTIFLNQQKHNDEIYKNITNKNDKEDIVSNNNTKSINIQTSEVLPNLINLTKLNIDKINNIDNTNNIQYNTGIPDSKIINISIELEDLDSAYDEDLDKEGTEEQGEAPANQALGQPPMAGGMPAAPMAPPQGAM